MAALDVERDAGSLDIPVQADLLVVVPVERNVERGAGRLDGEGCVQTLRDPYSAGVDADQAALGTDGGPHLFGERRQELFGVRERFARHGLGCVARRVDYHNSRAVPAACCVRKASK